MKLIALLALLLSPLAFAEDARPEPGWVAMCERDPRSLLCYDSMYQELKNSLTYKKDIVRQSTREKWSSQTWRYLERGLLVGDCEDFAITAIELALIHDLATPPEIRLVICEVKGARHTHAVAVINGYWFDYEKDQLTNKATHGCNELKHLDLFDNHWRK